ncbi:hypothetical protein [Parasphingorhabdus sp.]|uniref:hypothetical protein n=1 Tax=Parasphingorhabdus sp. TaxID=2709688 RepID=UPI003A936B53
MKCNKCDHQFIAHGIKIRNSRGGYIGNVSEPCERSDCNGIASSQPGTYDHDADGNITFFISGVARAFHAPEMTREKVSAAKEVVQDASNGAIGSDEALKQLEEISATLASVLRQSGQRKINWELLLAIIVFIVSIYQREQDAADAQSQIEALEQQVELSQKQLDATQKQTETSQEMLKEWRKLRADAQEREARTMKQEQHQVKSTVFGTANRHERRKQKAIERRAQKKK